jgi:hypothetical protein
MSVEPGSLANRDHLIQQIGKPRRFNELFFKDAARKPVAEATIVKLRPLFS